MTLYQYVLILALIFGGAVIVLRILFLPSINLSTSGRDKENVSNAMKETKKEFDTDKALDELKNKYR